jgi:glycosyltransferase involved in cell wall biosynthesis
MPAGKTISAFVISYNEEGAIRDCLESIKWVDELVVVDSYSEDATVEIAWEYTDRIIQREFAGYVAQTRYAFEQTTGDWVLWLDSDERLTPAACREIQRCFEDPEGPDCDGFAFPRLTFFMDRWIRHSGWYPQHKLRLFRRDVGEIVGTPPHPAARVPGEVRRLDGDILHLSFPGGLVELVRHTAKFAGIAARGRYERGKRFGWCNLLFKPPLEFLKKYLLCLGFLDGLPGLAVAGTSAYYRFMRELLLWELDHGCEPPEFRPPEGG